MGLRFELRNTEQSLMGRSSRSLVDQKAERSVERSKDSGIEAIQIIFWQGIWLRCAHKNLYEDDFKRCKRFGRADSRQHGTRVIATTQCLLAPGLRHEIADCKEEMRE